MLEFYPVWFFILSSWYFLFSGERGMYRPHQCTVTLTSAKQASGRKVQVMGKKDKTMPPWSVGGA